MAIQMKLDSEQEFRLWAAQVRNLAAEREAIILAHNYQVPWIQRVADFTGDSLELSRQAAAASAKVIVFCGVHFMAETAAILAPDKMVLLPNLAAGCSLAATITAEQVREWKALNPGAVVVAYVNTSAEVKAEVDICCTSSNAAAVVRSIPQDKEILFLPDFFLGAHVERVTGRKLKIWMGECHVHAGISPADIARRAAERPNAEFLIHPECGCASQSLYLASTGGLPKDRTFIESTGGMVRRSRESASAEFVVATETGLISRLQRENPSKKFIAANEEAVCEYMKMITPANLLQSLEGLVFEVKVPAGQASRARRAIERMLEVVE